jgi:hypothetical protein
VGKIKHVFNVINVSVNQTMMATKYFFIVHQAMVAAVTGM